MEKILIMLDLENWWKKWHRQNSVISVRAMDLGSEDVPSNSNSATVSCPILNKFQPLWASMLSFTKVKGLDYN